MNTVTIQQHSPLAVGWIKIPGHANAVEREGSEDEPGGVLLTPSPNLAISDYAIIGDCRTAALVSRYGSIDWLCLPHFSSPSAFARILDPNRGGFCSICPASAYSVRRSYVTGTPVLQTTFQADGGIVRLTDGIPILDGISPMRPMCEVLRTIEVLEGRVEMDIVIDPRPDYGRTVPLLQNRGPLGWSYVWRNEILKVRSTGSLGSDGNRLIGRFVAEPGRPHYLSLSYTQGDPAVIPLLDEHASDRMQQTVDWWQEWTAQCTYTGPYAEAVRRSAVTLKLLHFSFSGAIVAAPTASLPEWIGGDRNWDYRYCWLRDAGMTMQALLGLGLRDDAEAFLGWLLHATRLTRPELNVLYDLYGRTPLDEQTLDHFDGYRNSRPVRIGNGAHSQSQIDIYGEVVMAAHTFVAAGGKLDRPSARMLTGLGRTVCKQWREPDSGIWEPRGPPRHHTHSKMMCWVALDRLLKLQERGAVSLGRNSDRFRQERDEIARTIEERGFNASIGSYANVLDGDGVDASLLLMVCNGYKQGGDPRMASTHRRIEERLGANGLLFRYEDGYDGMETPEGAFGICSFWSIDNYISRGETDKARELFEYILTLGNDVGLFGEEFDPSTGATLGNFPQAFTHVGLINTALSLEGVNLVGAEKCNR